MTASDPRSWMWNEALAMIERAEQLHRRFFEPGDSTTFWQPPVDVFETEREFWIIAALPGVAPEDVKLSIEGDLLHLSGQRRLPLAGQACGIRRLEIPHGRFERNIRLAAGPLTLDRSELANGCLVIHLGKA
jgi:HSP20 family protein